VLVVATIFLTFLAFTGLPKLPLLILAICCAGIADLISSPLPQAEETEPARPQAAEESVTKFLDVEAIELELGHGLIRFTESEHGGDLVDRLARMKRQIATELGLIVPSVHVTDNPQLDVNDYVIKLRGQSIARGVCYPDQFLAIDEGEAAAPISPGDETEEPVTGRLAYWITESQGSEADHLCYRVVEAPSVLINHLTEVIRSHAAELLTRQNVKELLDNLRLRCAAVVDEVIPAQVKPGELQKVLQNLLRERVPIRDLETIVETAGDCAPRTKDVELLTEYTRAALGRTICRQYVDENDRLSCLVLASPLEELITGHVEQSDDTTMHTMPPHTSQRIAVQIADLAVRNERDGRAPVVLCSPSIRPAVRKILVATAPQLAVLSVAEVTGDVAPDIVAVVGEEGAVELQGTAD
jgi:flagellar biosynthesis protein FlhA